MRKNATKLAAAVLSLAMVMTSVSMPASAAKKKTTKINKSTATLYTNGSKSQKSTTLYVTVGGKKVKATFKSSNTKILTVAKATGKVTAKKPGKATVTATYKKKNYKCTVTVKAYATSVKVSPTSVNLVKGKTKVIKATVSPSNASNKKVSFKSSNKAVATVSSTGKVTAKKKGTAKIIVTALGSKKSAKKAYVTVKVNNPAPAPTKTPATTATPVATATPAATETPAATVTPSAVATKGTITITTNVTGASVSILEGATVVTSGSTFSGKTYTSEKIKYGTYVVTVTKEGYKAFTQTVVLNGDDVKVDAQLESVNAVKAELKDAYKVNDTKVQVNFTNKIAVPTKDNFSIEGLTISDAKITDDQKSVILTVSGMVLDKTYTVKTKNIVDANGKAVADGSVDFTARKITYQAKLEIKDVKTGESITQIKSDGKETAKFVVTLLDDAGNVIKDNAEVRFTTTAGNFAETKVSAQSGVATNIFTSEISATKKDALVTATVVASDNKDLINIEAKRTLSMSPVVEKDNNGASLTDVMVETCDRVILYFNKDVNVTDYTKNTTDEKYSYDSSKMEIEIADNAGTYETVDTAKANGKIILNPVALAPVKGESKALYAILPEGKHLTDNAKTIVKITDKTKAVPTTESKPTYVTDIRTPSMLSVTNEGLKRIKITFSEPVQNSTNDINRINSAELLEKWVIDNVKLGDEKYGASYGSGEVAKAKVGTFDVKTGEDTRNVVTITLGKDKSGEDIYFPAGSHSVQGNKIGDWANVTDTFNNLINTQTLDFVIKADKTAPTATVNVESPEQFDVKFNTPVNKKNLDENLKLQQYKDGAWVDVSENPISIRPVKDTDNKEYIVELTKDWTKVLDTNNTKKNYYNFNFRLYLKKDVVANVLNGLKNAEITLDLNDTIMKTPDVTSTEMSKVEIKDNKVVISMSEPVQLSSFRTTTPKAEQGEKVSMPIVQFISSGDKETIQGHIVAVSDHDNQITVEPDKTITTGTWKVVVRNVSDDVGNTSPTLVKPNFIVDKPIEKNDFNVLWVVAVKKGTPSPINGVRDNDNDVIYVKFNKQIKTYGNTANAGATTNYTVNGYSVPTTSKIDSSIEGYNKNAVTKNSYSDIVAIHLKENVLTAGSNTINISKTLESATGDHLGNGGLKLLTNDGSNNVFTWNYAKCVKTVMDPKNAGKISVADLQKFFNDGSYANYDLTGLTITDTVDKTFTLKHTAPVDFDNQTIKELNINTQETGVLEIKNVTADKITINAPNADVKLTNVKATTVDVTDVLDGSLILDGTTNITKLNVTDANAGAVEVASNSVSITNFTVKTTGNITLKVESGVNIAGTLPTVEVQKACKLNVQNAGIGNITIQVNKDVKLDDMKITAIAAVEGSSKLTVLTCDSNGDYKPNTEIVKTEVQGATFSKVIATPGRAQIAARPATAAATVATIGGIGGSEISGTGKVEIRLVEGSKVTATTVDITDTDIKDKNGNGDKIDAIGAKIAKATFTGYTVSYDTDANKLTFRSNTTGKGHKINVIIDTESTLKNVTFTVGTPVDGEDEINESNAAATPGTAEFTVNKGTEIAGTVTIKVNGTPIKTGVATGTAIVAGDSPSTIATKIAASINETPDNSINTKVKAVAKGATVIIKHNTPGEGNNVEVDDIKFTAK